MEETTKRLRELRKKSRKSQQVVADFCEIRQATLSEYECGKSVPRIDILCRLARYYHVSLDYLVGLEEDGAMSA